MKALAFSPGQVTGFFEICLSEDALATGSRGAGMCLSLGAKSEVVVREGGPQRIRVTINGKMSRAEVSRSAVRHLIGNRNMLVDISTRLGLPQSQGFGMSAAGALSAVLALADIIGDDRQRAFEAAHMAEIECGTGLGDVSSIYRGGATLRKSPGLPPIGEVVRIKGEPDVVLAVVGRRILTKKILADGKKRKAINVNGSRRVEQLARRPSVGRMMDLSSSFAIESGLASLRVVRAMQAASDFGIASMSMLGNSVFAIGDRKDLARVLSHFGSTYACAVDSEGARLL